MNSYSVTHEAIKKIKRLAVKHSRQAENACNGRGWLNGKFYTLAALDAWELAHYPGAVSGYTLWSDQATGDNVFYRAMDNYELEIRKHIPQGFKVEFQNDPRGATVKLFDEAGKWVEL